MKGFNFIHTFEYLCIKKFEGSSWKKEKAFFNTFTSLIKKICNKDVI